LKLPAELRNHIYHFALTTSKGLYLDPSNPTRFLDADAKEEYKKRKTINLLKFTCHQLYKETADIEIKFNRVELLGPHQFPGPAQAFNDFLSRCTATKAQWLREVTLWFPDRDALSFGNCVESEAVLLPIVEFCRNYIYVDVRYMPHHFKFSTNNPDRFIMIGVWLSLEFRGKDLRPSVQAYSSRSSNGNGGMQTLEWIYKKTTDLTIDTPNFRFWPKLEVLDQSFF
jgi:hypothetical protein